MRRIVLLNPFRSKYFFWVDSGIIRYEKTIFWTKYYRNYPDKERLKYLNDDRLWIGNRLNSFIKGYNCKRYIEKFGGRYIHINALVGGMIVGTKNAILRVASVYDMTFYDAIKYLNYNVMDGMYGKNNENKMFRSLHLICDDQSHFFHLVCLQPDLFTLVRRKKIIHG